MSRGPPQLPPVVSLTMTLLFAVFVAFGVANASASTTVVGILGVALGVVELSRFVLTAWRVDE